VWVVRTIVQLREDQHDRLRELAADRGTSIAALVRKGVDEVLRDDDGARRRRIDAVDQLASLGARGPADLGRRHDAYLEEW
jgi:hypothetical protein